MPDQPDKSSADRLPGPARPINRAFLRTDRFSRVVDFSRIRLRGAPDDLIPVLLRLLYQMGLYGSADSEIIAGEIPQEILDKVPIPENSRIIGSMGADRSTTVIFETMLTKAEAKAFYDERLLNSGWSKADDPMSAMRGGGFESQFFEQTMGLTYCGGENGPVMTVRYAERVGTADIYLLYNESAENTICDNRNQLRHQRMMGFRSQLPSLSGPDNAFQMPANSGNGDTHASSQAHLSSDKSITEIAQHYRAQLEKAGWTETSRYDSEMVALTAYSFKDEEGDPWQAMLSLTARPDFAGYYYLLLDASQARDDQPQFYGRGMNFIS
jgi:hypothetical protein